MRLPGLLACFLVAACGSKEPPHAAAPTSTAEAPPPPLSRSQCESLSQWITEACSDHANVGRSSKAEGWCAEFSRGTGEGGTWVQDCTQHFKPIDDACFRSTTHVGDFIECDRTVDRIGNHPPPPAAE